MQSEDSSYPRSRSTWLFVPFDVPITERHSCFDQINHIIAEVGPHRPPIPLLSNAMGQHSSS